MNRSLGHDFIGGKDANGNPGAMAEVVTSPNDPAFWLHPPTSNGSQTTGGRILTTSTSKSLGSVYDPHQ